MVWIKVDGLIQVSHRFNEMPAPQIGDAEDGMRQAVSWIKLERVTRIVCRLGYTGVWIFCPHHQKIRQVGQCQSRQGGRGR